MTNDEIRKFILWLNTLGWSRLSDLAAGHLASQKRKENRKSLRRAD